MDTAVVEKTDLKIDLDESWAVIFHNDDKTSMEFVISVLVQIFSLDFNQATRLMLRVHEEGKAAVALYPTHDIADQKAQETTRVAQAFGFPLQVTVEQQ